MESILAAWEDHARRYWKGPPPDVATLRDHAQRMLRAVVKDMESAQTGTEQQLKAEGENADQESEMGRSALKHALARVEDGFDIGQLVAEFRALRASVIRIWTNSVPVPHQEQIDDMVRFNEALDQLVAASIEAFTERIDRSRRLFLGMLGHDLRQPLQSLGIFIEILAKKQDATPAGAEDIISRMAKCCDGMSGLLADLLDFTSSQLGDAMPVNTAPADLEAICRQLLTEVEAATPDRRIALETTGDLQGEWDANRLRQLISNLLSNARHHGAADQAIHVTLRGSDDEVELAVHNMGPPIPQEAVNTLFDPMVRLAKEENRPPGSVGLGLFICRQIAIAHGGEIHVESSAKTGTTFTVTLPKRPVAEETASR